MLWMKKIFESYFSDRLTFSNIRSRTSRQIYRLALPLRAPETLSSLELALEVKSTTIASPLADQTTSRIIAELGKNARRLCLRRCLNYYREDVKRNRGNSLALQTQNFSYTDPFLLDRLLEIEGKCYLFHTLPT